MTTREPVRVILFGAGFSTDNLGVGALTVGAIKCMLLQYPQAEISLLDYGKTEVVHSVRIRDHVKRIPVVNMRFSWRVYLGNNIAVLLALAVLLKLLPSRKLREWVIRKNDCLRQIHQADVVASIAGGDSFSDIYGLERLLYMSLPQILAVLLGQKLVLLPQTIGPFRRRFSRAVARYILRRADHIYSRDRTGLQEITALIGAGLCSQRASFCYDVAFVMDSTRPDRIEVEAPPQVFAGTGPLVGVNISGLLYMGGYTRNNMFGLRADYRNFVPRVIDLFIGKGASVVLVPHVFGAGDNSESDLTACDEVYERLKSKYGERIGVVRRRYDQGEIKYLIGQCDFFVGSRMHSCIAAVSQCVPAVSVAYSDKFIGVMATLGIESLVADARSLTEDQLLDIVERNFDLRSEVRGHLVEKMKEVEQTVTNVFSGVVDLSSGMTCREPVCVYPST
jgi:colanic acid/amylovoran biosynthesis protein